MPQITSPLSTPTGMPALNSAHLGKAAGLRIHFALFSDFTAAITTGTSSYAADLWADGQEMTIASEADSGAVRVWRTALGHARTVKVGRLEVVLPANSNVVLAAAGVPVSGTGANGDLSVDKAAGIAYLKTAGAWGAAGNISSLSSATAAAVEAAKAAGSDFRSGTLGPVADLAALNSTYPPASNALKSAYVTGVGFFDCDGSAWTLRIGVAAQPTVDEVIAQSGGLPFYDLGDSFDYKGIPIIKWKDPASWRYVVRPGTAVAAEVVNDGWCSDGTTAVQTLGVLQIPGASIIHNDRADIRAELQCVDASGAAVAFGSTSCYLTITIVGQSQLSGVTWRVPATSTSVSSIVADFSLFPWITNAIRAVSRTTTALSTPTGNSTKRFNLLRDYTIEIGFQFAGTASGRQVSLNMTGTNRCRIEYYPARTRHADGATLRNALSIPFRDDSFWNIPLPPSATYADETTDAQTAAVTGYGQTGAILGNDYGGLVGSTFNWINGRTSDAIAPYLMSDSDPLTPLYYDRRQPSGHPWPFVTNTPQSTPDTIYLKLPRGGLPVGQAGDNIALLITPDRRWCIEVGKVSWNSSLQRYETGAISVCDLFGMGMTLRNVPPYSTTDVEPALARFQDHYRGTGLPVMGGIVTGADLAAGAINHMIGIQLSVSQHMASYFRVISASGTTFVIKPSRTEYTRLDYSSLFTTGTVIYYAGGTFTVASNATWNSSTNETTITVGATISGSAAFLTLGGIVGSNGIYDRQFVWPATTCDSASNSTSGGTLISGAYHGIVPIGTVFAIPPSVNLASLGLTPGGLILATAFQKYGGIDTDTTAGTFNLCQLDENARVNYASITNGFQTDKQIIRANLRRVTNYSRDLVRAGLIDKSVARPARLRSIY